MTSANLAVANLAFAPLFTTAKGAKQLPVLYTNGDPVAWQPEQFMEVPFEPSAFGDPEAFRVTLCFTPSETLSAQISELDAWCIDTIMSTPSLLGVVLTAEQVKERYANSFKTSEKGYLTLRTKMNKSGRYALQCYDTEKEKRSQPGTWRGCSIRPRIVWKGLWVMGEDFGSILETTHCIVQEPGGIECPFSLFWFARPLNRERHLAEANAAAPPIDLAREKTAAQLVEHDPAEPAHCSNQRRIYNHLVSL